ncbi:MAG: twin-arginine translocase TatA/TatE family subunit [Syntrophomonadaceae bacterium]|jgi:sec-independent protein translocase protein TatA|nr:twin-arginine translocase TatA/TatE family subunit [Syntrophomonadaceae bacterium]MDH7498373.1 twin-arginine translocase TatA/TatE family subunit [Syntrophomonadaceae bacterium]
MFGLIGNVGPWELVLVLGILLIIVGPGKLPQVGQAVGKALGNFKREKNREFEEQLADKKDN